MNSPYERWTTDPLWETVSAAVADLVENADLKEQTEHGYIVGYIVMKLRSSLDQVRSE